MTMKKVATKVVASNRRLKRYVIDVRASAGVSGRWGLSRHSANFFAQLLVGRSSRGVQTPLPFLYAGIEWRASEQLCKGISRVSRTPHHRPDTPALTLYPLVHSKYVYIPLIFIQEIGRNRTWKTSYWETLTAVRTGYTDFSCPVQLGPVATLMCILVSHCVLA